jgi:hypothetical protein
VAGIKRDACCESVIDNRAGKDLAFVGREMSQAFVCLSPSVYLVPMVGQSSFLNQVCGRRLIRCLYVVLTPTKGIRHGLDIPLRVR